MKKSGTSALKVKAGIKAGGFSNQHNRRPAISGLKVTSAIKAGGFSNQHNRQLR